MIEKFLKAKHWQIFMVTFGLPFLIQIIMMPMAIMGNDPMSILKVFPIIMILFIGGFGQLELDYKVKFRMMYQ